MLEGVGCSTLVGLIPVPESGMESGELELMFESWDEETMAVTDIAPTTLPLVVGVNVTLKVALWPGAKLSGRPRPLNWNSLPLTQTCKMVRFVPLGLVSVPDWVALLRTNTAPKPMAAGLTVRWP